MNPGEAFECFAHDLVGRCCTGIIGDHDWIFRFESDDRTLLVESTWRIRADHRVALARGDDEQSFGLPAPIDASRAALDLLAGRRVVRAAVMEPICDLVIEFDGGVWLDVFVDSSGYESWKAGTTVGERSITLIAMGGGELVCMNGPATR